MSQDEKTIEKIAADRADWVVDAVATATQNRAFLRGDEQCDPVACEAIFLNSKKAIRVAITTHRAAIAARPVAEDDVERLLAEALEELTECANDLEGEILARSPQYEGEREVETRRRNRDLQAVVAARATADKIRAEIQKGEANG